MTERGWRKITKTRPKSRGAMVIRVKEHLPESAAKLRAAIDAIGPRLGADSDDAADFDESHEDETLRSEAASLSWTTLGVAAVVALHVGGWLGFWLGRRKVQDE